MMSLPHPGNALLTVIGPGLSARRNFRFKSCRSILEKVPAKSGVNQVDLGKAAEVAVDLYGHCTLVLCHGTT